MIFECKLIIVKKILPSYNEISTNKRNHNLLLENPKNATLQEKLID